ncbi:MAG: hypothetical protein ACQR33_02945 [Candidatus Saccharibacteria bacterium]
MAELIDPALCHEVLQASLETPPLEPHLKPTPVSSWLVAQNFITDYANAVPDITHNELLTCLDTYLIPPLLPKLHEEIEPASLEFTVNAVHALGYLLVGTRQAPHPSLYEPICGAIDAFEASLEPSKYYKMHEYAGLYTTCGSINDDFRLASTDDDHLNRGNLNNIVDALAKTDTILPDKKAEYAAKIIEQLLGIEPANSYLCENGLRRAFGALHALDPTQALQLAQDPRAKSSLLLGILDCGQTPPAELLQAIRPEMAKSQFLWQDIITAYSKRGEFETAHQLLLDYLVLDPHQSAGISTFGDVIAYAIRHGVTMQEGSPGHQLLRQFVAFRADYVNKMGPTARIQKACIESGQPELLEAFAHLHHTKKTTQEANPNQVSQAYVYANDLDQAVRIALSRTTDRGKADNFYHLADALYAYDPQARGRIAQLCETSRHYYIQAKRKDIALTSHYSVLGAATRAKDYGFMEYISDLIDATQYNSASAEHLSSARQKLGLQAGQFDKVLETADKHHRLALMANVVGLSIRAAQSG